MLTDESWGWDLGVKTMKKGWRPGFKPRDFLSSYQIYCRFDLAEVKWQNSPWHLNSLMVKKVPGLCVISCASSVLGISPYHLKSPKIPHPWFFASLREVLRLRSHHRPTQKPHAATWNGYERSCPGCMRSMEIVLFWRSAFWAAYQQRQYASSTKTSKTKETAMSENPSILDEERWCQKRDGICLRRLGTRIGRPCKTLLVSPERSQPEPELSRKPRLKLHVLPLYCRRLWFLRSSC